MEKDIGWIWRYSIRTGKLIEKKYYARRDMTTLFCYLSETSTTPKLKGRYVEPGELMTYDTEIYFIEPNIEKARKIFIDAKKNRIIELRKNIENLSQTIKLLEESN